MEYFHIALTLDPLHLAAATLAILLAGTFWTSVLFGKASIRLSGIRPGDVRPEQQRVNAIVGFIIAVLFAVLIGMLHTHVQGTALFYAVGFIWLFVMLTQLNAFVRRREPFALFLIMTTRSLAMLMAGAAVFYFWS